MSKRAEQITATILGCGSSGGVPRVGNIWGDCDPTNPKNRRRRCALLIQGKTTGSDQSTNILIDTGCDLREQLLDCNVAHVDAVFYTHEHADHTHGIDDLRVLALNSKKRVDVYLSKRTEERLRKSFNYCFEAPPGSGYPPILNAHNIESGDVIEINGPGGSIAVSAFAQEHGDIISLGFRVHNLAYSCDVSGIPAQSLSAVTDLDVWILDALRRKPHPSHLSFEQSLELIERLKPREAVLTNMHIDLDYAQVEKNTPYNVTPAYDGLVIDVTNGKVLRG